MTIRRIIRSIVVEQGTDDGNLVGLVRVQLAEKRPEELTALGQEVSKTHIASNVASVSLEVIVEASEVFSDLVGVIQINLGVLLEVVYLKVNKA